MSEILIKLKNQKLPFTPHLPHVKGLKFPQTLSLKLMSGFMAMSILSFVVGMVGLMGIQNLSNQLDEVALQRLPSVASLLTLAESQTTITSSVNAMTLQHLPKGIKKDHYNAIDEAFRKADTAWKSYENLNHSAEESVLLKRLSPEWAYWSKNVPVFLELSKAYDDQPTDSNWMALKNHVKTKMDASYLKSHQLIGELSDLNIQGATLSQINAAKATKLSTTITLITIFLAFFSAISLGLLITRGIAKPVKSLEVELNTLSNSGGNLARPVAIETKDEIGKMAKAVNGFLSNMRTLLMAVVQETAKMRTEADTSTKEIISMTYQVDEISATTQQLAAGIQQNAAATTSVKDRLMEIEDSVDVLKNHATAG